MSFADTASQAALGLASNMLGTAAAGGVQRLTQQNRPLTIDTPLGQDVLLVDSMVADEHVSRMPSLSLQLLSYQPDLELKNLIGQTVLVHLKLSAPAMGLDLMNITEQQGAVKERYFHGYVASFQRVGTPGDITRYRAEIVPWLWFLTRSTDCRIFQDKSVVDILKQVFEGYGFQDYEFNLRDTYTPFEYCVQYRESDYNFVTRLLEQEGIWWRIRHEKDKHVLVMGDHAEAFTPLEGVKSIEYVGGEMAMHRDGITSWTEAFRYRVGKMTFRDFNYAQPSSPMLHVEVPTKQQYNQIGNTEVYDYGSLYDYRNQGERYATLAMEAEEAATHAFEGKSFVRAMSAGGRFTLLHAPSPAYEGKDFVLLSVVHEATNDYSGHGGGLVYHNDFTCLSADIAFRPRRSTPKPFMQGTQTAIVVGPKGEEIFTDKQGRVKVHFHWDRLGQGNEKDSIWVRVSQPWAGPGWGGSAIPRIGQEVIVSFIEGDPDNPIIVGRVYNGEAANPYGGTLGETMGIRSKTHKGEGFNELKLVDTNGAQEFFMHAQKDMNTVVRNNRSTTIGVNKSTTVLGTHTETIKGDTKITITEGGYELKSSQKNITLSATTEIVISVGKSSLRMDKDGNIVLKGVKILTEGTDKHIVQGGEVHLNPGADAADVMMAGVAPAVSPLPAAGPASLTGVAPPPPKPPQPGTAGEPPPVYTGLGSDVDQIAAKSPTLQKNLRGLKDDGWTVQYGKPGSGSYTDLDQQVISIDGAEHNNPQEVVQSLAHETGHAEYNYQPDISSRDAYVNGELGDEGEATISNIRTQREILKNGGPDIGIAGNPANTSAYNAAYDQMLKDGDEVKARNAIGKIFGNGERTSTTNELYKDYYGKAFDTEAMDISE